MICTTLVPGYGWPSMPAPQAKATNTVSALQERRTAALEFIAKYPGASSGMIAKAIGARNTSGVTATLLTLIDRKQVSRTWVGGRWTYYITQDAKLTPVEQRKEAALEALRKTPGMPSSQLAKRCGCTLSYAQKTLISLVKSGHVQREWSHGRWWHEVAA